MFLIKIYGFLCTNLIHLVTLFVIIQSILFLQVQSQKSTLNNFLFFFEFFQFDFVFQRRSFLLVFQQIIDHLDNDLFENQDTRSSLTILIYLNRPPYDSILDLGIIERNIRRLLYHFFLFLSMNCLNFLLFKFILKRVNHIMLKELKSLSTQQLFSSFFCFFSLISRLI